MAGWHHQCNACEVGQIPGDGEGQAGLACCRIPKGQTHWATEQQQQTFLGAKSSDLSQIGKPPTTLQPLSFHLCIPRT